MVLPVASFGDPGMTDVICTMGGIPYRNRCVDHWAGTEVMSDVGHVWFIRGRSRTACISTNRMFAQVKYPQNVVTGLTAVHPLLWLAVLLRLCQGKGIYCTGVQQALVCPLPNELYRNYMTWLCNVSINQELLHWSQWDYGTVKVMYVRGKPEPWDEWLELSLSCRIFWHSCV